MSPDFRDLLAAFNAHGVEFLIVGAHALAAHGHVRATKDLDVFIRTSPENAVRAYAALADFGAPLNDLTEADLRTPGIVFQIGVPPVRIDLVTEIDGVEFADAWNERVETTLAGIPVAVLSLDDLIRNKKTAGRLQDLADVEALEMLAREPFGDR
jgi:predicted nucleotidyltransferase